MSAVHPSRPSDESILEAWFEKDGLHCKLEVAAGADHDRVREQMVTLLTEAAGGRYWAGRWRHVDLDARWHVMRVTIDEADADLDEGHVDAHRSKRVKARELIEAARDHLVDQDGSRR